MLAAQRIYGPDDGRQWSGGPIAMGRRLYRTLPEDIHDRQPLTRADEGLAFVADVRLDNREDLLAELGWTSSARVRASDADVLFACLRRWDEGALGRLVGDFAFALWNEREQTLVLARDFLGQRPLYYHRGKDFVAFSSMAKGLHALPEVPYAADEQRVAEFLALVPEDGPRSFFQHIDRVDPGHVVTVTRGAVRARRYWFPSAAPRPGGKDYADQLRHHLDEATRSRLRGANGAVATHLSSGFDSAAVTATAARLLAPADGAVVAFTAVPREGYTGRAPGGRLGDEGPLAAATAADYPNIEHVLVRSGGRSPLATLDRDFFLTERPVLNLCNRVWMQAINEEARKRKLNVLLTGQRGNMTLSYAGFERLPELFGSGHLVELARQTSALVEAGVGSWRGMIASFLGPFIPAWLWRSAHRAFGKPVWDLRSYTAIHSDRLNDPGLAGMAAQRRLDLSYRPWADGFDMRLWALGRGDPGNHNKAALAGWGIDQRDPTADRRLVEFCLSVPMEEYLNDGVPRSLAKRALADRLPQAVLSERRKGYQAIDWHEGLTAARDAVRVELEQLQACRPASGLLDLERLRRLVDEWPGAGWEGDDVTRGYRLALLRGISAGHFLRKASGSNA